MHLYSSGETCKLIAVLFLLLLLYGGRPTHGKTQGDLVQRLHTELCLPMTPPPSHTENSSTISLLTLKETSDVSPQRKLKSFSMGY